MPDHSLSPLPPDLAWLIDMEPTLGNVRAYLRGQPPAWAPQTAHRKSLVLSNIFTSPRGAPGEQLLYDLDDVHAALDGNNLADAAGSDLYIWSAAEVARGLSGHLSESAWPEVQANYAEEAAKLLWLCEVLGAQWRRALHRYAQDAAHTPADDPRLLGDEERPRDEMLFLSPHIQLPDAALITLLSEARSAFDGADRLPLLLLLTARHELGYLYSKTNAWSSSSVPTGSCLTDWDWGLLAARDRAIESWRPRSVLTTMGQNVTDVSLHRAAKGDIAHLYNLLTQWVRTVQRTAQRVKVCNKPGCANPVRGRRGGGAKRGGAPSKYCEKHTTSRTYRSLPE